VKEEPEFAMPSVNPRRGGNSVMSGMERNYMKTFFLIYFEIKGELKDCEGGREG
jgi:hypothetical protein